MKKIQNYALLILLPLLMVFFSGCTNSKIEAGSGISMDTLTGNYTNASNLTHNVQAISEELVGGLGINYGGTGTTTAPSNGQLLIGNSAGGYSYTNTSSLNINTDTVTVPTANHGQTGNKTSSFNAGYSASTSDLMFLDSNGTWQEANASSTASSTSLLAVAMEDGSVGGAIEVALPGSMIVNTSWSFTIGQQLYVSTDNGAVTSTQPSGTDQVIRVVGFAIATNTLYFLPSSDYMTHT